MPRGLFRMGTLGWTPAAQLATQNQSGAAASYAAMDKAVNQTQTTKTSGGGSNIFGDIMPIVGAAAGFALGGGNPLGGMALGSALGGGVGTAMGGRNAASLGRLGTLAAGTLYDMPGAGAAEAAPNMIDEDTATRAMTRRLGTFW